jgi:uncharacterized membrane protein YccC
MSGFWLVSYIVLWALVIGVGLVILALAREIEALHTRLDSALDYLSGAGIRATGHPPDKRQEVKKRREFLKQVALGVDSVVAAEDYARSPVPSQVVSEEA